MRNKGIEYRKKEDEKYEEWVKEMDELNHPVYIMSSSEFWLKDMGDRMSEALDRRPVYITEKLKKHTDKMRYRSLSKKKQFVWLERLDGGLKSEDVSLLHEYLASPSEHGVLVVSLPDRKAKNEFLKEFKMIRKSQKVKLFEMEYVSSHFKKRYIQDEFIKRGFFFESEKVKKSTLENLLLSMEDLKDNLMTLESLEVDKFTKEIIQDSLETYSDTNIRKFYDSLTKLTRKKVPYKILHELLEDGVKPIQIMRGLDNHFNMIYQAKYLTLKGILRSNDIADEKLGIYEDKGIVFKKPDLWSASTYKKNKYLRDCEEITLKEIVKVLMILDKYKKVTRVRKGDQFEYQTTISEESIWACVIDIMERFTTEEDG